MSFSTDYNPEVWLNNHGDECYNGSNYNNTITVTINSFQQILNINFNQKNSLTFKTDFGILEALDNAKLNFYKQAIDCESNEKFKRNIQFRIDELTNRPETYIKTFLDNRFLDTALPLHSFKLLDWYNLYNTKYEYIDIIEFIFYLNKLDISQLNYRIENYHDQPEFIFN